MVSGEKEIEKEGWVVFNIRGVFFENDGIIYILSFPATAPFSTPGFGNNFSLVTWNLEPTLTML